jgi:hypothetical protein
VGKGEGLEGEGLQASFLKGCEVESEGIIYDATLVSIDERCRWEMEDGSRPSGQTPVQCLSPPHIPASTLSLRGGAKGTMCPAHVDYGLSGALTVDAPSCTRQAATRPTSRRIILPLHREKSKT